MPRMSVYVDGYNLYHRRLQGTAYKWLDLRALADALVPGQEIKRVRYFTTWAQPHGGDGKQQARQQAYIRALRTTKGFSVAFGLFREREKHLRKVHPPPDRVWVWKTEEKGSDVNLASFLLLDAFKNEYDTALVISNDADLKMPINMVRHKFGKKVIVAIPGTRKQIKKSALPSDEVVRIEKAHLKASLFPATFQDQNGTITKPPSW
jgi:uncharacterized LabA/DUF88 family protein